MAPMGGSSTKTDPSNVRSLVSFMPGAPAFVPMFHEATRRLVVRHGLAKNRPELVQGSCALTLDVAWRAAKDFCRLVDTQVGPVPEHNNGPAPARQGSEGVEYQHPHVRVSRRGRPLRKPRSQYLANAFQSLVRQIEVDERTRGIGVCRILPPDPAPRHEHVRKGRLSQILGAVPVTSQQERRPPQP